jgi:transposase-like protein
MEDDSMSDSRTRRHFTAAQKAEVVRRHVSGKAPVSVLADELKVQPSLIHLWIKQVLDQAEKAFERSPGRSARRLEDLQSQKIAQLESRLAKKNEVVAELMEAHVQLKKELGEL